MRQDSIQSVNMSSLVFCILPLSCRYVIMVVENWCQNYTTKYSLLPIATATGLYSTYYIQRVGSMLRLRVREVAQEKRISMSKLSRIEDVNYKTIQTIWKDPYHGLNTITLNKIAQALEVPTSELIEDVPDQS